MAIIEDILNDDYNYAIPIKKKNLFANMIESKILDYLSKKEQGETISNMARELNENIATIAKYVSILEAKGKVNRRVLGRSHLVTKTINDGKRISL